MPRAAILADQEGSYVYVVDDQNIARQRRVRLGQVTPETAGMLTASRRESGHRRGVQGATQRAGTPALVTSIASRS